ncbi:MAG: hypothetical protein O3B70_09425 [Bacteroidetes bacterium]|nr:hypothetical protein [Bacteroidota bacterium]
MRYLILAFACCACATLTHPAQAQTVPCACADGNGDEVITNTDFLSQLMTYGWGDSIPSDSGTEPGMCDLDGDGTRNLHDFILLTSLQNQYCQGQDGEEVLTLVDTIPSTFQGWVLELVADHTAGLGDIPAGAQTYRLYADFASLPESELRMIGPWGDETAPWFIDAPGGLYVSAFSAADENALPSQGLINPLFVSVFPEVEFSSFWTVGDMWSESPGVGTPYTFTRTAPGQRLDFEAGDWSSASASGSGMLAVAGSIWNDRVVVDGLHLMGQFTVLDGQEFSGQAGMALVASDQAYGNVLGIMVIEGAPFDMTNLEVFGCIDEAAVNYDASATYDNGTCEFCPVGDADCDGIVAVSDLLDLLGLFGCMANCGWADLDGDGSVGASDVITWLALPLG